MESITTTIGVTHDRRVRLACPQVASRRLAVARGAGQGRGVAVVGAGEQFVLTADRYFADAFGAPTTPQQMDVVHHRPGGPPA